MQSACAPWARGRAKRRRKALVVSATYPDSQGEMLRSPVSRRGPRSVRLLRIHSSAAASALLAAVTRARGSFFRT